MMISINLLPPEFASQDLKQKRFYKLQIFGVAVIIVMVFLSSLTVSLRILQSQKIGQVQNELTAAEQKVSSQRDKEASLAVLKNRLSVINQYINTPSKQVSMYTLVNKLIPNSIVIATLVVDRSGSVILTAIAPDSQILDSFLTDLTNKEKNQDKIGQLEIDGLSRGRDNSFRLSLKIKPKV